MEAFKEGGIRDETGLDFSKVNPAPSTVQDKLGKGKE